MQKQYLSFVMKLFEKHCNNSSTFILLEISYGYIVMVIYSHMDNSYGELKM